MLGTSLIFWMSGAHCCADCIHCPKLVGIVQWTLGSWHPYFTDEETPPRACRCFCQGCLASQGRSRSELYVGSKTETLNRHRLCSAVLRDVWESFLAAGSWVVIINNSSLNLSVCKMFSFWLFSCQNIHTKKVGIVGYNCLEFIVWSPHRQYLSGLPYLERVIADRIKMSSCWCRAQVWPDGKASL